MSTLIDNYGWVSLLIGIVLLWFVIKVVRKIVVTVIAIIFTLIGLVRLWMMIGTL
ncbi:MAG: hypothetical protein ABS939_00695 [Psychrobacillus sp.]